MMRLRRRPGSGATPPEGRDVSTSLTAWLQIEDPHAEGGRRLYELFSDEVDVREVAREMALTDEERSLIRAELVHHARRLLGVHALLG